MNRSPRHSKLLAILVIVGITFAALPLYADESLAKRYFQEAARAYEAEDYPRAALLLDLAFNEDPDLVYKYNEILAHMGAGAFETAIRLLDVHEDALNADPRFGDVPEIRAEALKALAPEEPEAVAEPEPVVEAPPSEAESVDPIATPQKAAGPNIVGWSLVGVGVAGLATGALFGSEILIQDVRTRLDDVASGERTPQEIYGADNPGAGHNEDLEAYNQHHTMKNIFLISGALFTATGITLLVLDIPASNRESARRIELQPAFGPGFASATLHYRF